MILSDNACPMFDNPIDWVACNGCCKHFGIDLNSVVYTMQSYSLVQICLDILPMKALDLATHSYINLVRWKKTFKSKFLLRDHPMAKRQIEALGILDGTVRKFDEIYISYSNYRMKNFDRQLLIEYFKQHFEKVKQNSFIVDNAKESVRKILKLIRLTNLFQKIPDNGIDEYFDIIAEILLSAISKYCSEDSDIVIEFIKTVCIHPYYMKSFFTSFKNLRLIEFLMRHANSPKFEIWEFFKEVCTEEVDPIGLFIGLKRYDLVRVMMRCGYKHRINKADYLRFIRSLPDVSLNGRIVLQFMLDNIEANASYSLLILFAVFGNNRRTSEEEEMLRLLLRNISIPFVTPDQLLEFSKNIVKKELIAKYIQACSEYKDSKVCDEPNDVYRPRSLLHLCRITIRERLRQNHQLPSGVEKLGVPLLVQNYLNLDQ